MAEQPTVSINDILKLLMETQQKQVEVDRWWEERIQERQEGEQKRHEESE